jgi:hypothetical protein
VPAAVAEVPTFKGSTAVVAFVEADVYTSVGVGDGTEVMSTAVPFKLQIPEVVDGALLGTAELPGIVMLSVTRGVLPESVTVLVGALPVSVGVVMIEPLGMETEVLVGSEPRSEVTETITGREPVGRTVRTEDGKEGGEIGGGVATDPLSEITELGRRAEIIDDKSVGRVDGIADGKSVGRTDGKPVGRTDDKSVGRADGKPVGRADEKSVGRADGKPVGRADGKPVGRTDKSVGRIDDKSVGRMDDRSVGRMDDRSVGRIVGRISWTELVGTVVDGAAVPTASGVPVELESTGGTVVDGAAASGVPIELEPTGGGTLGLSVGMTLVSESTPLGPNVIPPDELEMVGKGREGNEIGIDDGIVGNTILTGSPGVVPAVPPAVPTAVPVGSVGAAVEESPDVVMGRLVSVVVMGRLVPEGVVLGRLVSPT